MRKPNTLIALAAAVASQCASAQEVNPELTDRVQIFAGAWFVNKDENLTVKENDGTRVDVDFQGLGFDDSETTGAIGGVARFTKRLRLDVFASSLESSSVLTFPEGIPPVGGDRIRPGDSASARFEAQFIAARLGFAFVANDQAELGVSLGAAYLDAEASAETAAERFSVSETGAVPTVGLFGTLALSPKWALRGRASVFNIEHFGSVDEGNLYDVLGAVTFRPVRNLGVGVGYGYISGDVEVDRSGGEVEVDWSYHGPMAFAEFGFGSTR